VVDPRRSIYHPAPKTQYFCDAHHKNQVVLVHLDNAGMSAIYGAFISTSRALFALFAHIFV
jgi:hypothetical protein